METEPNNNDSSPAGLKHDVIDDVTGGLSSPPPSTLTLRMIMQGKEAGSIIGKKGDNVKKFREESGARINISDASCPERIVTITGSTQQIVDAFSMICRRFEEDLQSISPSKTNTKQLITLRLILPASQCGSLIGKGGAKIKEIREVAGASIQISGDMLANSTERLVTVSGSVDAVTRGIFHICQVMLECPAKGVTVPYRPKLALAPVIVTAGGQTYAVQGQYIVPQPVTPNYPTASGPGQIIQYQPMPPQFAKLALQQGMLGHLPSPYGPPQAFIVPQYPVGVSGYVRSAGTSLIHPATAAQQQQQQQQQHVHEMKIPNDLIGCIIGRGGSKINEIRQLSGANIKIAGVEEGCSDRTVTITGLPESIGLAQHLINASLEFHANLLLNNLDPSTFSTQLALPPPPPSQQQSSQHLSLQSHVPMSSTPQSLPSTSTSASDLRTPHFSQSLVTPSSTTLTPVQLGSAIPLAVTGPSGLPMAAHLSHPHHGLPTSFSVPPTLTYPAGAATAVPLGAGSLILAYDSATGAASFSCFDPRSNLATKIKGGYMLASVAKGGNKFSPY